MEARAFFVAHARTGLVHDPESVERGCQLADLRDEEFEVYDSSLEAYSKGFRPCPHCFRYVRP